MQTHVSRWGNSLGIRIPQAMAAETGLEEGAAVDLKVEEDRIVVRKKRYTLKALLSQVTLANQHREVETGKPRGSEIW